MMVVLASLCMTAVVLIDIAIPHDVLRCDLEAFYFSWPIGEWIRGFFVREIHIVLFGYRYHAAWMTDRSGFTQRTRSRGWQRD